MRIKSAMLAAAAAIVLGGCTPEETFVAVNASALKCAARGELASAKVEMVFDIQSKDDPDLPNKIRKAALPYLGQGAVIEIEKTEKRRVRGGGSIREDSEVEVDKSLDGAKLVARFDIPIGVGDVLDKAPRSIMWLKYTPSDKTFRLLPGNAVRALNSSLSTVNSSVEFEYDGGNSHGIGDAGGTTIKIIKDDTVTVGVAAVKVNGRRIVAGSADTADGSVKISYNNDFYAGLAPCFTLGAFPSMSTVILKKKSAWEDD